MKQFCDLMCRYAEFPKESALDGSGSCRTFLAIFCTKKNKVVFKNVPCEEKEVKDEK